jgi:hypothetical protein
MSHRRDKTTPSSDRTLAVWSGLLALVGATAFAAWRAVADDAVDSAERLTTFGSNLLWPGVLIFFAIAAMVWMGWKLNLD